jgi:hypothetical protein
VFEGSGTFSSASQPRGVLTEKVGDRSGTPIRERTGNRLLVLFDSGDEVTVQAGEEGMRFLLVSGKPIEEPVAWYGPIVMNTEAELTLGAMRPSRPHKVRPQQSSFCGPPVNVSMPLPLLMLSTVNDESENCLRNNDAGRSGSRGRDQSYH